MACCTNGETEAPVSLHCAVKDPSPYKADSASVFCHQAAVGCGSSVVLLEKAKLACAGAQERGLRAETRHLRGPETTFLGVRDSDNVTLRHTTMSKVARRDTGDLGQGTNHRMHCRTTCVHVHPAPRQRLSHSLHVPRRGCQHTGRTQET